MAKPNPERETRALFRKPGGEIVTSIMVTVNAEAKTITLLYDYPPPDFSPMPGWTAEGRGFLVELTTVNGRKLTYVEV